MIETTTIEEQIGVFLVQEALQGDATGFDLDTNLIQIAAIDSMSMISLVAFLEETFEIDIGPHELSPDNLTSVRTISAMVRRLSVAV